GQRLADTRFEAVYSSDLVRARETAEIIVAASNTGPYEIVFDQRLREVSFGKLEGKTWTEMDDEIKAVQHERDLGFAPPGGESYRELLDRLGGFADMLQERHTNGDVLVVGHGAAFRALVVRMLQLPDEAFWSFSGLRSASVSRVRRRDDGRTVLFAWSDAGHLDASPPQQGAGILSRAQLTH
ncbi:MAG: histidine phosphatase family protein, partial [Chloroflexi bacterium]|nr:histidine phosphatase family protein [Chloroflexota bacterium]